MHDSLELRCGRTLRNRCALAPLTNLQSSSDGTLGEEELRWLAARAPHFGVVSTCAAYFMEQGHAWDGQLGVASSRHDPGLTRLAAALESTTRIVQLHHGGAKADVASDRIGADASEGVRAAEPSDLDEVIEQIGRAAERSLQAGFDGVEVHGANGYLFCQFLAPEDNHRSDHYGGRLENRARLLLQAVREVRGRVGDAVVGVRISPVDVWSQRGLLLEDSQVLVGWLAEAGVDYVHLSLSDASAPPPHEPGPPVVRAIRAALDPEVALMAAGGVWSAADAEAVRELGADLVAVGRSGIIHPDWPERIRDPGFEPTRPPWTAQQLEAAAVSPAFVDYLRKFRDLVAP